MTLQHVTMLKENQQLPDGKFLKVFKVFKLENKINQINQAQPKMQERIQKTVVKKMKCTKQIWRVKIVMNQLYM